MSKTEQYYYEKYLKYKLKYTNLQNQSGGITKMSGVYCLFYNEDEFKYLSKAI